MQFWNTLPKPFFAMAPMADITDIAFRSLVAKRGAPDIFWSEFVSADGLYYTREIQKIPDMENPLMRDLAIKKDQHPIVAQIFSANPEMVAYASRLIESLGFDGVDINMGCPDRSVEKQGAGAMLMKTPEIACAIIRSAKEASSLPVSVKTRIGYNDESLEEWLPILLEEAPSAITIHLRTRKEMSLVSAHWEIMKKAVEIRNSVNSDVLLIGNGDIENVEQGTQFSKEFGCDGVMIGRGMFGNPWVFEGRKSKNSTLSEKLVALIELAHNFEEISPPKNFYILKKHIKAFVNGFVGANALRAKLMDAESAKEIESIINNNQL